MLASAKEISIVASADSFDPLALETLHVAVPSGIEYVQLDPVRRGM
jgi:hypothetical protein